MFKKTLIAGLVAAACAPTLAAAADSPHSISGNVGIYSEYIFRGLSQTNGDPALQGGFDYAHSSGFYAGTWMSNISWLTDSSSVTGYKSSSLEWDFYGGYKGSFAGDFGYDVGVLQYYYPGTHDSVVTAPGSVKADTLELYGALSWKWLSAKYSQSVDSKTFGVANSRGTYYFDLSAAYPATDKLTLIAHYGIQKFKGDNAAVSNDSVASYKDWKLGATYALPQGFTIGGYYTDTDMTAAQEAFYTNVADNRFVGKSTFTAFVSKSF